MQFRNRQSDADDAPDQDQDPLSPYSAPTVRRQVDRGGTQPLDAGATGAPRSDTQIGTDFSTRQVERRARQGSASPYPQRFGEMARKVDNRQLFLIGGGLILLLVALLAYRAYSRSGEDPAAIDTQVDTVQTAAPGTGEDSDLAPPAAGALVTAGPGLGIGEPQASAAPAAPAGDTGGGASYVVAGTGTEGLFLRADASSSAQVLTTLPEGTKVEATGETTEAGGRTWRKVRTANGEGWVAADFVVPAP